MFKRKSAEQKAQEKAQEKEIAQLANASAKAYFKSKGLPAWTAEYQTQYAVYVMGFVRAYKKNLNK